MKKNLLVNLAVSLVSLIAVFGIAEAVMRFAWQMGGWVERPIYRRSFDPYLRYELVPGVKDGRITINSAGLRGTECALEKPEGTFRILMLGDSETFSFLLEENNTLPVQLEALLNQKPIGKHYEVLNFGVEGYCTFQELEQLKTKGLKYQPDLIILNYCLNDPEPGEYYFDKSFLIRHSALVRYWAFRIKKSAIKKERKRLGINTEIDNYNYYYQSKYFEPLKEALLEMGRLAEEATGRKLVVVIFPTSSIMVKDFKGNYPYWQQHKLLKGINSKNIEFIDLIDEFNRLGLTPQQVSINYQYDESHKNPMALATAASYIYNDLERNKLISE